MKIKPFFTRTIALLLSISMLFSVGVTISASDLNDFFNQFEEINEIGYFKNDSVDLYYNPVQEPEKKVSIIQSHMPESFLVEYKFTDDTGATWYIINTEEWLPDAVIEDVYPSYVSSDEVTFTESEILTILCDGTTVSNVVIERNESATLTVDDSREFSEYRWQIFHQEQWVNIFDATDKAIRITYPMIFSMLNIDKSVHIRCVARDDEERAISEPINITVEDSSEEYSLMTLSAFSNVDEANSALLVDETEDSGSELETYTVIINYVYQNGEIAAPSWSGTFPKGSEVKETIQNPTVTGFAPEAESCTIDITSITQDKIYTVIYYPAEVEFKVYHYKQNAENDYYALDETETRQGYTGTTVGENLKKEYEGFYAYNYDTTLEIAADGSTEVEIYYDRYYYLMSFDLGGGYGVEPIYARYGTPISVGTPNRPGYSFEGWDAEIPDTMPAENKRFIAQWTAGDTSFDVVFWYENANDDSYSQAGVLENVPSESGEIVNGAEYKEYVFSDRDDEHFTYFHADENVTVQGDGSTVVNVYFNRNEYTLTFVGDVLTCTKAEHKHSHDECCTMTGYHFSCNTKKCPYNGEEHEHKNSCYDSNKTIITVTKKYDSDITSIWSEDPIKSLLDAGYVFQSSVTEKYYSFLEKMPGQDITMTATEWDGHTYTWYYYLEILPGVDTSSLTTRVDREKTYFEYDSTTVTGSGLSLTYEEDYYPITGFTQRDDKVPEFDNNRTAYLYYTRNSYTLNFSNNGNTVTDKGGTFLFEADISDTYFQPEYPANLEPNAYVFDGWYTSPYYGDTQFNFSTTDEDGNTIKATMPANDLTLYAKWTPKTHTVKIYKTYALNEQIGETQTVPHGSRAEEPAPTPTNGSYSFVGWFYIGSDGIERGFDFSMPVNQDLVLYAKWSSNVLVKYTIKYAVKQDDETYTYIAQDTTGQALAGTTKTFLAKAGDEIDMGYSEGYFPETSSHSITLSADDASENTFTFVYVPIEKVNYIVRYIDTATGKQLISDKQSETTKAIVTETFEVINGYMPDAYQKTLVLSAYEQENIITFYYIKDTQHAPVQVIHYIQNIKGDGYTVYQNTSSLNTAIGGEFSASILSIDGFTFTHATANNDDVTPETGSSTVSSTVTAEGLVLELYYNRNVYPYEFRFVEEGTEKVLADSVTGTDRYGAQVVRNAESIYGYTPHSNSGAITIKIEEEDKAERNVYTFYYKRSLADLTITKLGADDIDENQSFIFKVTGIDENNTNISITVVIHGNDSVTIKDLPVGKYQVKEINDWSWRYTPTLDTQTINVDADETTIPFKNERKEIYWLDGNAYCDNRFGKPSTSNEEEGETNE